MLFYFADDNLTIGIKKRRKGLEMVKKQESQKHAMACKIEEIGSVEDTTTWRNGCHSIRQNNKQESLGREENATAYTSLWHDI